MDISSEIMNLLRLGVKSRQYFPSLLLTWDGKKISPTSGITHHLIYFLGMALTILYAFYLLYQLGVSFSATKSERTSLSEYVDFLWVLLWTLYYFWGVVAYFNHYEKSHELATFLNGLARINGLISSGYLNNYLISFLKYRKAIIWLISLSQPFRRARRRSY